MKRVLITGMSGAGKTTVIRALAARGYRAFDADEGGLSHWVERRTGRPAPPPREGERGWDELDWVWHEGRVGRLLEEEEGPVLFLAGTSPNQGKFREMFDLIILLSAPLDVMLQRLAGRKNNPYGSTPGSRARVLRHVHTVEPLLRRAADHELDTSAPLDVVLRRLLELVNQA